jgi:hypothetical protein
MEWYKIIGVIVIWFVGLYLRGRCYELWKDYKSGGWKNKGRDKK